MTAGSRCVRSIDYNTLIGSVERNLRVVDFIRCDGPITNFALCEGTLQTIDVSSIDDVALNACGIKFFSGNASCGNTVSRDSTCSNL